MTKEELAALITGREYGAELTEEEEARAKEAGLLVIFGASDDLTEIRGTLSDEAGANDGATHRIDAQGFLPSWDSIDHDDEDECEVYLKRKGGGIEVRAKWGEGDYSWVIETDVPHATFEIVEGDEKYCRGIVIDARELAPT